MLAATDDILRTFSSPHLAVTVLFLVIIFHATPSVPEHTMANVDLENGTVVYHLRVLFICDKTSSESFCAANITNGEISNIFSDIGVNMVLGDCENNSSCSYLYNDSHDYDNSKVFVHMDNNHMILRKHVSNTTMLHLNITYHLLNGNIRSKLSDADALVNSESADVLLAVGDFTTVQTVAIVADGNKIPNLGYITEYGTGLKKNVQAANYVSLNPSVEAQGKALAQIIGQFNMKQTTIIIEKSRYADGFLHGVRQSVKTRKQEFFNVLPLDQNVSNANLRQKLIDLTNKGWKVIVLHCSPDLMLRVVTVALSTRLYNSGYAWFLSEMAFSRDKALIAQLPEGLLAIDSFWLGGVSQVMAKALEHVISASTCLLGSQSPDSHNQVPYKVCDDGNSYITRGNYQPLEYNLTNGEITDVNLRSINDFTYEFTRCLRMLLTCCDEEPNLNSIETRNKNAYDNNTNDSYVKESNTDGSSGVPITNTGPAFYLLNTVDDGTGDRIWSTVGYITARGERDLKTVLWPGHNIYGPSSSAVKTYRVVTRAAEPFVFISSQVSRKEDCFIEVPCLKVDNSSQALLTTVVDDFQSDMKYVEQLYTIHCCKGLSLEILEFLAIDLNFRYVIYFVNDSNYGTQVKDVWTGMVGDVVNGAADIVAGAFSVTSERMNVMDFTEPFYQNKFSLVTAEGGSYVSIWAFLNPFSSQVWLCIMFSSIVAGVATAFLEWHSPFGLNPRGRKRTKNYGLGSGLLMVMVLLTGHTINIKAPKSWPGKVIQNVWAGLAIFIMTSYTANLAAYLAGQSAVTSVATVYDPELLTKRVAIIPSSAVETFLEKINPKLSKRAQMNPMVTTNSAINLLREQTIDIYLDDVPLLEYSLAKNDKDCKVRFAGPGKGFGSDGYAFGLARQSWLQIPMSNQILWYTESGYIQELARKYLSRPQCEHFLAGSANPYGLEHTGGLFIILVTAMCLALLFHLLEHLAYRYLVPWLRKQPNGSFWKTENLAFISQRVFRVVRSEKLFSQKKAAQEMIKIVKQRDFTKLIQKHELQKRRMQTQKRIKTKADIFHEITANIISYHRQQQTPSENADSSDAEGEQIEDIVADVIQGLNSSTISVNDAPHVADKTDLVLDVFFGKRGKSSNVDDELFPDDIKFDDEIKDIADGRLRKLSSRSWCMPGRHRDQSMFRKRSDSYILYPPNPHPDMGSYISHSDRHLGNGISQENISRRSSTIVNTDQNQPKCQSEMIIHNNDSGGGANSKNTFRSQKPPSALQSLVITNGREFLLSPGHGTLLNQSLAPLPPVPSCSDENPELSPPTSENTDDLSSYNESLESLSTIPSKSSNKLVVPKPQKSQSLISQGPSSRPTLTSPAIVIEQPSEISFTPLDVGYLDPEREMSSSKYDLSTGQSDNMEETQVKYMPRSKSSEVFSFQTPQNNNSVDLLDFRHKADSGYNAMGIPTDSGYRRQSDIGISNSIFTIEGNNPEGMMRALRKSSDISPIRSQLHESQQQNNTRRTKSYDTTGRDYFKRNIKMKDNRVKSTLRKHALSGYQSHLPADFIDDCTLEALSKEDVLILWKKSEIDLESKLHEVLAKNRRLGLAIDYLTRQGMPGEPEEV